MRFLKNFLVLILCVLVLGCAYDTQPPASRKTIKLYKVQRGETLYSIAWRYSLDYRQLAYWNKIPQPYRIYPGQRIFLNPPPGFSYQPPVVAATVPRTPPARTTVPQRRPTQPLPRDIPDIQLPFPKQTSEPKAPAPKVSEPKVEWVASKHLRWQWPTQGRVVRRFSESISGKQGVNISGRLGQPVTATARGKVVYSGNGLKGYGELVIIKHNETFLSAYAHNRKRVVKEGAVVSAGQKIAELGQTGTSTPVLHFEIRENGKPVDPLKYLPKPTR